MNDVERTLRIFDRVLELTRASKLDWSPTPSGFRGVLEAATVKVISIDDDGQAPFSFEIIAPEGAGTIGEFRSKPLDRAKTVEDQEILRQQNTRLKELYSIARRKALGIDAVFDRLEHELDIDIAEP